MQVFKEVNRRWGLGLHVSIPALVEVHLLAAEVALRSQAEGLAPESICLAVGECKQVFFATDAVESER